ncbi:MAG TPA: N-6 DNA methylase [Pseudobdellovibrionaceae bacterium]|nr:N-6 DNA methylase [Pseudobdellovibrionaceae bacterium]
MLQLVVALFSEDVGLIPKYTLHKILGEAVRNPITQKELTLLFEAMSTDSPTKKQAKYKEIPFFNGGIFHEVEAVELNFKEIDLLYEASKQDWSKVRPSIFGSIFEASMDHKERHGHGIHYTSELDIQKIVNPTIVRPFREKIEKAKSKKDYAAILKELREFKVLDPACGSGNFLYISFRELRKLEVEVMDLLAEKENSKQMKMALVSPRNFYGIDTNGFGLELAKVALCIGRKLSADEFNVPDNILPFENLDENFLHKDALLIEWPKADVIVGNPPYLSSKYLKVEFPVEYVNGIRKKFKDVPGRADYCVYWFRKAHDVLESGKRAGLVGTNTIRQNYSRIGGLDYIVQNGGEITEAVSTQVWSGDASVHVSIVNWIKGSQNGKKRLYTQLGDKVDSPWKVDELQLIPSALSSAFDVTEAKIIKANRKPKKCFQGQSPASEGFYISPEERELIVKKDPDSSQVIFPFLIGREMLSKERAPKRFVIDFGQQTIIGAKKFKGAFDHIEATVLPDVQSKAENELEKSEEGGDWNAHLQTWWKHWRGRPELFAELKGKNRFIAVSRVTKRPIFEFVSTEIHPGDALIAFAFDDDYSFGIIHSEFHWQWFKEKCSTLKGDFRYTADSVFDTFVWPQNPTKKQVEEVASAGIELRTLRNRILSENKWGLKDLYRTLDLPGKNPLKEAHAKLDEAVRAAYGMGKDSDSLKFLLDLNFQAASKEANGEAIQAPGLPKCIKDTKPFISGDCIKPIG